MMKSDQYFKRATPAAGPERQEQNDGGASEKGREAAADPVQGVGAANAGPPASNEQRPRRLRRKKQNDEPLSDGRVQGGAHSEEV